SYFVPGKTRQGYETLGKKKAELEGRFHEKGMWAHEGFCARQGWVEVWGSKVNDDDWELSLIYICFSLSRYFVCYRLLFCTFFVFV
ncbi:hypothetical protein Q6249_28165, partial [Klebsiella pneumoniae]|uniref:hypothetical protein n=1 Tax=Klebsiella pneumoniae TaxID=573 RepID=UPI002731A56F